MSTFTQTLIHKISLSVYDDLTTQAKLDIATFVDGVDSLANLKTLCDNLETDIAALSGFNSHITSTSAINTVYEICKLTVDDRSIGSSVFFHDDNDHSHSFYTCNAPNGTPTLLYTATNDLSSLEAASVKCDAFGSGTGDLYGSHTNSCVGVLQLGDAAAAYCFAGVDYLTVS